MFHVDRWERQQRARGAGWFASGEKRREYIESLKPLHLRRRAALAAPPTLNPATTGLHARAAGVARQQNPAYPIRHTWPPTMATISGSTATNAVYTINAGTAGHYVPGVQPYTWTGVTNNLYADPWHPGMLRDTGTGAVTGWDQGVQLWANGYQINGYPTGVDGNGNVQFIANQVVYTGQPPYDEQAVQRAAAKQRFARQLTMADPQNHRGQLARANSPGADFTRAPGPELVALELLKGMLPPEAWRRYLTYGFLMVTGKSGLHYQIVRSEHHLRVYRHGRRIADLCLFVPGVPPTDEVITKKILVECDELSVWMKANIRNHAQWPSQYAPTDMELQQLAAGIVAQPRPQPQTDAGLILNDAPANYYVNAGANVNLYLGARP